MTFGHQEDDYVIWYFNEMNIVEYNENNLPANSRLIMGRYPQEDYHEALITKSQYEYLKKYGGYLDYNEFESSPITITPIWVDGSTINDDNIFNKYLVIKSYAGSLPLGYKICGIIDTGDELDISDSNVFRSNLSFFSKTLYINNYENIVTSYAMTGATKYEKVKKKFYCIGPYEYDALCELIKYEEGYGYTYEISNVTWPEGYGNRKSLNRESVKYRNYFLYMLIPATIFGLMFAFSNISVIFDKTKTYKLKGCYKEFVFFSPSLLLSFVLTTIVYLVAFIHKSVTFGCTNMFMFPAILYGFLMMIGFYVVIHLIMYCVLYLLRQKEYVKKLEAQVKVK